MGERERGITRGGKRRSKQEKYNKRAKRRERERAREIGRESECERDGVTCDRKLERESAIARARKKERGGDETRPRGRRFHTVSCQKLSLIYQFGELRVN